MKDLIKQIEDLRTDSSNAVIDEQTYAGGYNNAIYDVINLLQSYPVIHAKALRKKGAYEYYVYQDIGKGISGWFTCMLPNLLADTATMKSYKALSKKGLAVKPPKDSELVNITIIVNQKGGEG